MLGGFVSAALFLIARQVIKKDLIPRLNRVQGFSIIKLIVDRLFLLSIVAMLLGFAAKFITNDENLNEEVTMQQQTIRDDWQRNTLSNEAVNEITTHTANNRYSENDLKKSGWGGMWHTTNGDVIADLRDQRKIRVYLRKSNSIIIIGSRDFAGTIILAPPYNTLGHALKATMYHMSNKQSPPKLIIQSTKFGALVFELGEYYGSD